MKIVIGLCVCACLICGFMLWYYLPQRTMERAVEMCMGTICEVTLVDSHLMRRREAREAAFTLLKDIERRMSVFDPQSEVSALNAQGGEGPVFISPDTHMVIEKSLYFAQLTNGAFDITTLPLSELWGFTYQNQQVPSDQDIQKTLSFVGSDGVSIGTTSEGRGYVKLRTKGMKIDLGGIAKGYACDAVVSLLKERGVPSALVNIGGTVYGYGKTVHKTDWKIGLRDPRAKNAIRYTITLQDQAIATSGDYEQFFMHQGKRYSHILDPRTGMPVEKVHSVSIIAPHALTADALSTAVFVMGPDEGISFINKIQNVHACMVYEENGGIRELFSRDFSLSE